MRRGTLLPVISGDTSFRGDETLYRFRIHDETCLRG